MELPGGKNKAAGIFWEKKELISRNTQGGKAAREANLNFPPIKCNFARLEFEGTATVPSFCGYSEEMVKERIEALLEEKLKGSDQFVIEVKELPKARIQVFLDSDSELTIARCAEISRYLEAHLEEEALVPEHYTLEVSSPGVDRPLSLKRQYVKNIGRKLSIKTKDGKHKRGLLKAVEEDAIVIEKEEKKKNKSKEQENAGQRIAFEQIDSAKVLISFK